MGIFWDWTVTGEARSPQSSKRVLPSSLVIGIVKVIDLPFTTVTMQCIDFGLSSYQSCDNYDHDHQNHLGNDT